MKRLIIYCLFIVLPLLWNSCVEIDHFENNARGNFDALWKILDEHYCFFEYKEIDWDEMYEKYNARINDDMNEESLFKLLCEMLAELKDGHVNLYSPFDAGRYWSWYEDYPNNYNEYLIKEYLGTDYAIASGMNYKILEDNIGYIRYSSFSSSIGESNLDYIIDRLSLCKGIIIDVRENGGGYLSNVEIIASRFINEKTRVGYIRHKTGKGHNDFSKPQPIEIEPSKRLRYQKPVIVLTNRHCYSATNAFVNAMRYAPNVITLGDQTGGGSGLPFSSEIPNGWAVRFSASPMFDAEMNHLEFGIQPDVKVDLKEEDLKKNKDTLIESARQLLQ